MDQDSKKYLERYLNSLSPLNRKKYHKFDAYHFCADEENANICAELVLKCEKRATASLVWSYEYENEPLPEIGQLVVITDWNKTPKCIIETISIEIRPYRTVDAEFAFEEGEGDKSLAYWKKEHWKFFSEECKILGKQPNDEMSVIFEKFKVVFSDTF